MEFRVAGPKTFIALLRAVNVGGTGKLAMSDLKLLCERAGFANVRTYIASGNVLFESERNETAVKAALEKALGKFAGKPVGVLVRTADEMTDIATANPFADKAGNRTVAIFLDEAPANDILKNVKGQAGEEIALGKREVYIFYKQGIANSKLRIPGTEAGTARNMNTVARLAALSGA
jgi:uncharacterized protein (DUF1697 family)